MFFPHVPSHANVTGVRDSNVAATPCRSIPLSIIPAHGGGGGGGGDLECKSMLDEDGGWH